MSKELVSFPDLAGDLGGYDLLASAVRKSAGQQENKDVFKARVLKKIPMFEAKEIANSQGVHQIVDGTGQIPATSAYFVQIIDRSSPHAYLPEPCAQGSTGLSDTGNNNVIQALYTIAIDQNGLSLSKDSVVFVKLNKKDFSYDTDFGWIQAKAGTGHGEFQRTTGCAKASESFSNKKLEPVPANVDLTELSNSPDPNGTVFRYADGVSGEEITRAKINAFTNLLSHVLKKDDIPELIISSAYRGPDRQANAMRNLFNGTCKGGIKNGKAPKPVEVFEEGENKGKFTYADSPCWRMYSLYGQGSKIQRLLKVDWTDPGKLEKEIKDMYEEDPSKPISEHLNKNAFDLQTKRIAGRNKKDPKTGKRLQMKPELITKISKAIQEFNGTVDYETSPPHLHVVLPVNLGEEIREGKRLAEAGELGHDVSTETGTG